MQKKTYTLASAGAIIFLCVCLAKTAAANGEYAAICSPYEKTYSNIDLGGFYRPDMLSYEVYQIVNGNHIFVGDNIDAPNTSATTRYVTVTVTYSAGPNKYLKISDDGQTLFTSVPVTVLESNSPNPGSMTNKKICPGSSTSMTLSSYTGTIVKWQKSSGTGWSDIAHTSNVLSNLSPSTNTSYRAILRNACGNIEVESDAGTITVMPIVPQPSVGISGSPFCNNSNTPVHVSASVIMPSQYPKHVISFVLYDPDGDQVGFPITFEDQPAGNYHYSGTFPTNLYGTQTGQYSVMIHVDDPEYHCSSAAATVNYTEPPPPAEFADALVLSHEAYQDICNDESITVSATGEGSMKWYQRINGNWSLLNSGSSTIINSTNRQNDAPTETMQFKVERTKTNICGVVNSEFDEFDITHSMKNVQLGLSGNKLCEDHGDALTTHITASPGYTVQGYTWMIGGDNTGHTGSTYPASSPSLPAGNHNVRAFVAVSYSGCQNPIIAGSPTPHNISVYKKLNPGIVPGSYEVCLGTSATFDATPATGGGTLSYTWLHSLNGQEQEPLGYGEDLTVNRENDIIVWRRVTDATCNVFKDTAPSLLTVHQPPTIGTLSRTPSELCGTGEIDLSLSAASADNITWYASSKTGTGSWTSWGNPIGSGTSLSLSDYPVNNPGPKTKTYRFKAVAERGTCPVAQTTFGTAQEVTVHPPVVTGTILGFGDEGYGVANGHLEVSNYQSEVVRWEKSTDQVNWSAAVQDALDQPHELSFENLTETTYYKAFVTSTGCTELPTAAVPVTIFPEPVITITGYPFIPPGGSTTIEVNDDYHSYQWYKNGVLMPGETGYHVTLTEPDNYTVRVKANPTATEGESGKVLVKSLFNLGQNLVGKTTFRVAGIYDAGDVYSLPADTYVQELSYLDGLARPYQTIGLGTSPDQTDMVQSYSFDAHSTEATSYLPYTSGERLGALRTNALGKVVGGSYATSEQYLFYQNAEGVAHSTAPYAQAETEASPLGRVKRQGAADTDWQLSGTHTVNYTYRTNTSADAVKQWSESGPGSDYAAGVLSANEITDENGNKVLSFTDGRGRTVLKKVQLDATIEGQSVAWLETYYVYDRWSNLIYQVPPKAVDKLNNGSTWDQAFKDEWVFQYVYDDKFRLIEKKTPDAGWTYIAYDPLDRPVLVQDANLRATNKWYYTKWDERGRPVMSGTYQNTTQTSRTDMQSLLDGLGYLAGTQQWYEKKQAATPHGYSNNAFPTATTDMTLLSVMYYDNHDMDGNGTADRSYITQGLPNEAAAWHAEGMLTMSKKRIVGLGTEIWLSEYYFYDKKGRPIQVQATNHLYQSAPDNVTTMVYAFDGLLERQKTVHRANTTVLTIHNRYEYDHAGRLRKLYQKNNSDPEQLVAVYEYNALGQLQRKKLHAINLGQGGGSLTRNNKTYAYQIESDNHTGESEYVASHKIILKPGFHFKAENGKTFKAYIDAATVTQLSEAVAMQSVDYSYNVRGWLKKINDASLMEPDEDVGHEDFFGMELLYNQTETGLNTTANYNGNISAIKWNSAGEVNGSNAPKGFAYSYDKSDKLVQAQFKQNVANWMSEIDNGLNESMAYDHNGNLLSLSRNTIDSLTGQAFGIDALSYTYASGNRLNKVADGSNEGGFADGADAADEMDYDAAGNLVKDLNKGISNIIYNELNKPAEVQFADNRKIKYLYDGAGAKLSAVFSDATTIEKTIDYVNGFEYHDNSLRYFGSPEGRVVNKNGDLVYEYALSDHQGNTRAVFTSEPDVVSSVTTLEGTITGLTNAGSITLINNSSLYNHTPGGSMSNRVNGGSSNEIIGMAKVVNVYPGDKVLLEVYTKYTQPTTTDTNIAPLISGAVMSAFGVDVPASGTEGTLEYESLSDIFSPGSWVTSGIDDTAPRAYLNYILFDRDYVPVDMGFKQLSQAALETGSGVPHQKLALEVEVPVAGYLYVYVSNESTKVVNVYFDDLKISHLRSPVMQTNDYYPFGAVANTSWTRETAVKNPYLYNAGSELNDKTNWYETFYRPYDPYLGRFNGVDVMADSYSSMNPYQYGLNDPVYWSDPTGAYAWTQEDEENRHAAMDRASMAFDRAEAFAQGRLGDDDLFPKHGVGVWGGPTFEDWVDMQVQKNTYTDQGFIQSFYSAVKNGGRAMWGGVINGQHHFVQVDAFGNTFAPHTDIAVDMSQYIGGNRPDAAAGVGLPGTYESYIPVWGSGRQSTYWFQQDDWGRGLVYRALAVSEGTGIYAAGKAIAGGVGKLLAKQAVTSSPTGNFYSVAFETTLPKSLYPGVNASKHITAANKAMLSTLDDATLKNLNIVMKTRSNGSIVMNASPQNWVWHHDVGAGVMQLVPKSQHTPGSIFWNTLHPGGKGGMSIWGGGY